MNKKMLENQIKIYETKFKTFMSIERFPRYDLKTKEASISVADSRGYEAVASTAYIPQSKKHSLLVSSNLVIPKYVLFHEFTHMLDSEMYANGDATRYAGLSGFTEYHASQVELMQLLGVNKIDEPLSFSMDTIISTIAGKKSVQEYINERQQHAILIFNRDDFPADIDTLKSALGVLYNYFGLRSICEMYATDYSENIQNESFMRYIPTQQFIILNRLMHNWLDEQQIDLSINIYLGILFPLVKQFHLV